MRLDTLVEKSGARIISLVGLAKNTGKTSTLNYLLAKLPGDAPVGLTSIGYDGEPADLLFGQPKPAIEAAPGTLVATASGLLADGTAELEVLALLDAATPVGQVAIARVREPGSVVLGGPRSLADMVMAAGALLSMGACAVLIDGALDRQAAIDPELADAVILSTGASVSQDVRTVCQRTAWAVTRLTLPSLPAAYRPAVWPDGPAWLLSGGRVVPAEPRPASPAGAPVYWVPGAVTDAVIETLAKSAAGAAFATPAPHHLVAADGALSAFLSRGGRAYVANRADFLAVTVNPARPDGGLIDASALRARLADQLRPCPVFDLHWSEDAILGMGG
jgi:hypothetical protein